MEWGVGGGNTGVATAPPPLTYRGDINGHKERDMAKLNPVAPKQARYKLGGKEMTAAVSRVLGGASRTEDAHHFNRAVREWLKAAPAARAEFIKWYEKL
jgi:hypothetical protein